MTLRKNLPKSFLKNYRRCVCIIDCTEIFIERPLGLNARAQTWSNYKNHSTIKYLVAFSPTGAITFLSHGWGGRVSNKEITIKSGFPSLIEHGDQILTDRGFTAGEEVASVGGILEITSFTKGKQQLSAKQTCDWKDEKIQYIKYHYPNKSGGFVESCYDQCWLACKYV